MARKLIFHAVEHRVAEACGYACDGAFHHAADRVCIQACRFNHRLHFFALFVGKHGERLRRRILGLNLHRVIRCVAYIADRINMRADVNAFLFKNLHAYCASKHERGGQSSRKMPAARDVVKAVIPHRRRIIGMGRAGRRAQIAVIP